jgi:hypothetical protein
MPCNGPARALRSRPGPGAETSTVFTGRSPPSDTPAHRPKPIHAVMPDLEGVPEPWAAMVERWHDTSTLTPKVRGGFRSIVAKAGRWPAAEHPEIVEPGQ